MREARTRRGIGSMEVLHRKKDNQSPAGRQVAIAGFQGHPRSDHRLFAEGATDHAVLGDIPDDRRDIHCTFHFSSLPRKMSDTYSESIWRIRIRSI